jgi:ribosome maturation factor RimP
MVKLLENISFIAENAASEIGLFLIDVNLRGNDRNRIIEIFVDGDKSVSAEDLTLLSKNINGIIEEKNIIESSYRLDVSTPGIDRPLKFLKQYPKHINRNFNLVYNENGNQQTIIAKLESIEGDFLLFTKGKSLIKINFKDILSAKVQISFS